jgi:hypothetical protein
LLRGRSSAFPRSGADRSSTVNPCSHETLHAAIRSSAQSVLQIKKVRRFLLQLLLHLLLFVPSFPPRQPTS